MKFFIYFDSKEHSFTLIDENTSLEAKNFLTKGSDLIDTFDSTFLEVQDTYQKKTNEFYQNFLSNQSK